MRISGRLGRQGQDDRARPTPARPRRRSSSTRATRRSPTTRGRSCARRRCSARPTSSSPRASRRGRAAARGRRRCRRRRSPTRSSSTRSSAPSTSRPATAFQAWMQGQAAALRGRGDDLSVTIASLDPFAEEADTGAAPARLAVAGGQRPVPQRRRGLRRALRAPGPAARPDPERQRRCSQTTAERNEDLATAFAIFPTFLRESRATLTRLESFSRDADPVVQAPCGRRRRRSRRRSPPSAGSRTQLDTFFAGLRTTIDRAPKGFPALRGILDDDLPPILGRLDPFLASLNSVLEGLRLYKHEITAFLGNAAAATQGCLELDAGTPPAGPLPAHRGAAHARGARRPIRTACRSTARTRT